MAQLLRPISTVTDEGNFTGATAHGSVDGTAPDTGDYWNGNDIQTDILEVLLTDLSASAPGSGTCTVSIYEAQADTDVAPSSGGNAPTYDLEVYEGTTQRAARTGITPTESTFTLDNNLTFAASAITDWSDVRIRFTSIGTAGPAANRRGVAVSYIDISVPDATGNHERPVPLGTLTATGFAPTVERSWTIPVPVGSLTAAGAAPTATIPRPAVGPFQFASHALTVNTYGAFTKGVAGDVTRSPGAGALALTGLAPTVERSWVVTPGVGTLTATGLAPTAERSWTVAVPVGSLTLAGAAPTTERSWVITPDTGTLTFAGAVPTAERSWTVSPAAGSLTLTGYAPTVERSWTITPDTGALSVTGYVPTVSIGIAIPVPAGTLTFAGQTPTAERSWTTASGIGTLALTGFAPTVSIGITIAVPAGTLSITGLAPTVERSWTIVVPVGVATFTGLIPTLEHTENHIRAPPVGSLTLSGAIPTVQSGDNHVRAVPTGTLTLAGAIPTVQTGDNHVIDVPVGSLSATGLAPTAERSWTIAPPLGTLTLAGQIPTVQTGEDHVIAVPVGSLTATGQAPTAERSWTISPATGTLTLAGAAPSIGGSAELTPAAGALTFTGYAPTVEVQVTARALASHGLVVRDYGLFQRDSAPVLSGAQANAEAAPSNVITTAKRQELAPHLLPTYRRNFSKLASIQDVDVNITGAEIQGQQAAPDSANVDIFNDGAEILAEAGDVTGAVKYPELGTLTLTGFAPALDVSSTITLTGAHISADSADVNAIGNSSAVAQPPSAEISADAGTATATTDFAVTITGAVINAEASEVGLDFKTGVSPTITGGEISADAAVPALAGPHVTVNIEGQGINAEAGEVEQVKRKGGHIRRKRRIRYVVEIDGQLFEAVSPEHAKQLLREAAEAIEEIAEETPEALDKKPVIRVRTEGGKLSQSPVLKKEAQQTRTRIARAFRAAQELTERRRQIDREISELLIQKIREQEEDDEEAILALLL